jgi:ribonuclease BN (tRNA processing enzyme)
MEREGLSALLDCGAGTVRTMARLGLPWQNVTHLLISHFHTDHVAGLAPLLFALKHGLRAPRSRPLHVLGPPGLHEHLEALCLAFGGYVLDPGFPVVAQELEAKARWTDARSGLSVTCFPTRHTDGSMAFRVEVDASSVGYTGDTGADPELGAFMRGCRLLVAECSHDDEASSDTHLTPSSLADLASEAGPELLVAVHAYPPLDPEAIPDHLRRWGYKGRVIAPVDGTWIELAEGRAPKVGGVDLPASDR